MAQEVTFRDGVPIFDGTAELFDGYRREAILYVETVEWRKRDTAAPRLISALEGPARVAAHTMPPGWFSHPKGVYALLDHLKASLRSPSLPEAGRYITKFFYGLKRKRGETMAAWLVRHDDALDDVKRTLCEAIRDYGKKKNQPARVSGSGANSQSPRSMTSQRGQQGGLLFDENGRLVEDENEQANDDEWEENHDWGSHHQWSGWHYHQGWYDSHREGQWHRPPSTSSSWHEAGDEASQQANAFLPDFVSAWMLLQRSGLDLQERSTIIANLKNNFSVQRVKEALRLTWSDADIRHRDGQKASSMYAELEEDESIYMAGESSIDGEFAQLAEEDQVAYQAAEEEAQAAYAAIQGAKKTLREAREKQTLIKKNRKFFGGSGVQYAKQASTAPPVKCFKCGGNHFQRDCPNRQSPNTTGQVHLVFMNEQENGNKIEDVEIANLASIRDAVHQGKAIIDGGATSSLGSTEALTRVRELQWQRHGKDPLLDVTGERPDFKFGDNGKLTCISTAQISVPFDDQQGKMNIHLHECSGQPVLVSVKSLRNLGAIIDFDTDQMILKKVNPSKVIHLERAASGHQLFPLADDIMKQAVDRSTPFTSLLKESANSAEGDHAAQPQS